jgi:hypothetical protein
MILTDRRLYQMGTIFERVAPGKVEMTTGKKVVSIRDITGTSTFQQDNVGLLVVAGLLGAFSFVAAGSTSLQVVLAAFAVCCAVAAFLCRKRFFVVEYAGGAIATDCRWYTSDEVDAFQKAISLQKDKQHREGGVEQM